MWVSKSILWDESHTDLSKYFVEKIKQRVDYEEIISNRHRTSNGYTLIHEIVEVALLAQKRIKSINRLISLVEEAKSKLLASSIVNDYILETYHSDIVKYYEDFNSNKLKDDGKYLLEILNKSKINSIRLNQDYYENIKYELKKIDFNSPQFDRNATVIDKLVDCLVPYLLHQGYSTTSISDIAYRYIKKVDGSTCAEGIVSNFDGTKKSYIFLIKTITDTEEFKEVLKYLIFKGVDYEKVEKKEIQNNLFEDFNVNPNESLYIIRHSTLDPHNYLRNLYEVGLKNFVASKERISLHFFTDFFESVYWRFERKSHKFQKSNMSLDPINVPKRKSSLRNTLSVLSTPYDLRFTDNDPIPIFRGIRDALYYYNLALGSKSIENSLSLLWTSLETLLPYRLKNNDIENVQYFVSKSLSIGAIGREVTSFASRLNITNRQNNHALADLGIYSNYVNYSPNGIKTWIEWLCADYSSSPEKDPYDLLKKTSNLLCKQFCLLNNIYTGKHAEHNSASYWLDKIKSSEASISYQLDRIYLHRNQIIHTGKFINEYSNLWNHLEWYVGKLLAFCVINYIQREDKKSFNKEELFMQLEADGDMLLNLLENHKDKKIVDIHFAYNLITKNSWQFF